MIGQSRLAPRSVPRPPPPSDTIVGLLALFGEQRAAAEQFLADCRESLDHNQVVLAEAKTTLEAVATREAAVGRAEAELEENRSRMAEAVTAAGAAARDRNESMDHAREAQDAEWRVRVDGLDQRGVALDQREREVGVRETAVAVVERALTVRDVALAARETAIAAAEDRVRDNDRQLRAILDARRA